VFRSRDGGETWEKVNESRDLRQRAWYYTRIYADPKDEDTVYVVNVRFHKSKDGGKTFTNDLHAARRQPRPLDRAERSAAHDRVERRRRERLHRRRPQLDGRRTISRPRSSTASPPTTFPYRLLGAQQDNSAVRIRSRVPRRHRLPRLGETAGGESGHIVAKPDDPDVVYGGSYGGYLTMVNHRTGEFRDVNRLAGQSDGPRRGRKYRFQWNFPMLFSPHDPNTLYAASQHLFRSTDGGASWERISGDLTRNDKSKMGSVRRSDHEGQHVVEYYGTIFAVPSRRSSRA
jgi:hypothetical protein